MKIGIIIKYYRKQKGWVQGELAKGICSVTHLSKFEKGTTKVSPSTIKDLCERLGIQMDEEIKRFKYIGNQLRELDQVIVKHQSDTVKNKLDELSNNPFIYMVEFRPFFLLLLCRYYLKVGNMDGYNNTIKELKENYPTLQKFEWNMKEHILGIKESIEGHFHKAIEHLMNIEASEYPNHEFYYHIASASFYGNDQGKTFFYANKALDYFKQTNNFLRIIDTEILLLFHMQTNDIYNFDETVQEYRDLIQTCNIYGDHKRKCILLNNLAYTYFMKKEFEMSQTIYEEAKEISSKIDDTTLYIPSLVGQIQSRLYQNAPVTGEEKEKWSRLIQEGKSLSEGNEKGKFDFQLLTLLLTDQKRLYYEYLYKELIPHLEKNGNFFTARFYSKETYQYFLSIEDLDTEPNWKC